MDFLKMKPNKYESLVRCLQLVKTSLQSKDVCCSFTGFLSLQMLIGYVNYQVCKDGFKLGNEGLQKKIRLVYQDLLDGDYCSAIDSVSLFSDVAEGLIQVCKQAEFKLKEIKK